MSISVFEHPVLRGLFGQDEIASLFSFAEDLRLMLEYEAGLVLAKGDAGLLPPASAERIAAICRDFQPDIERLKADTTRDGVVIPGLVGQLRNAVGGSGAEYVHTGATSQDVVDTAMALRLARAGALFHDRLGELDKALDRLVGDFGQNPIKARTRMQAAQAMPASNRLESWRGIVNANTERLSAWLQQMPVLSFGGAIGALDALGEQGPEVKGHLARHLGCKVTGNWHSNRHLFVDFANICSAISGSLGKIGQDIALMAQNEIDEIALAGAGGSSAMAHKRNPVAAEILVSLARFNATQVSGMHHALVHEQERSGSAWSLEWMLLPPMTACAAASLDTARRVLGDVERIGKR